MIFTLPNVLTLSRIAVIPLLVTAFYLPHPWAEWTAVGLFTLASVTDYLDGHLARRWKQMSAFGRFLDPIADKLLVSITLMMLVAFERLGMPALVPALIILAREILVSGLREFLAGLSVSVPVSRLAKWKTGIQMVAIGVLLVGDAGPAALELPTIGRDLLWLAAILTLVTGYDYLRHGLKHMSAEDAPKPRATTSQSQASKPPAGKSVGELG
ncbi:CDP-diacylglycerol--glycerol-3-phosphate 3-phosphatidyltransferase [Aliidongia dinghuensis]|uniref:CDP-diacylglycerol--glycerol-3-phosphate 3-phosphatidyltransferase n=1 Tax=Aliidongia dinghuensis TaxID=1867774 RepID=A0A8J2Z0P8_9PROT|nr:CDP-diacylglycerol--glycerol-3-phosphate 3-phosphatidyltransferase [Aliidongia dinghuensis]GGF45494.1 CDP-diacylglycerol--glycerol-3-phosphate 3-phosphatidyltransferase [Aliidongia dinghuensis]